jgi:hypothetical protein
VLKLLLRKSFPLPEAVVELEAVAEPVVAFLLLEVLVEPEVLVEVAHHLSQVFIKFQLLLVNRILLW